MAKSVTIKKDNETLYPKTVSALVYNNSTGNTVELDLNNKLESSDLKTVNGVSLIGSGNITIVGEKGDSFTYEDLTEAQKAEIAQPATEQAAVAARHLATIQEALDNIDPSQSTDDAIVALTAQLADTKEDVDTIELLLAGHEELVLKTDIDFSQGTVVNFTINSGGNWAAAGSSCIIPVNGHYLNVTANNVYNARVEFFNTMPPESIKEKAKLLPYMATYDTGTELLYYTVTKETTVDLTIPNDALYIGFWYADSSNNITCPASAYQYRSEEHIEGIAENVTSLIDAVDNLERELDGYLETAEIENVDLTTGTTVNGWFQTVSPGGWSSASMGKSLFVQISQGMTHMIFTAKEDTRGRFGFAKSILPGLLVNGLSNLSSYLATYTTPNELGFYEVAKTETLNMKIPSDANYVIVWKATSSDVDVTPSVLQFYKPGLECIGLDTIREKIGELEANLSLGTEMDTASRNSLISLAAAIGNSLHPTTYSIDANGYEIPLTREHLAAMKKAHQLTSIKWTPLLDVPRSTGVFPAGVEVTGIPYSSVKECNKYVGYDVSIHTFMTAVNNPYSLLYTECVSTDDSRSAWGITYHSTGANPARTYFGMVCSVFASQVCGLNDQWPTAYFKWLRNYGMRFSKNYDLSAQGLQIGDVYVTSGHTRCICALKRNSSGAVTHVEVAESYPYTILHTLYTAAQFDTKVSNDNATIYRNLELYKIKYEPSEYVAIDDETPTTITYNDDICTFAGDKATFREGDIIVIDYNLKSVGSWTQMELYKNNTLIDTIDINTSEHYVNLTSRNLTYGQYKARMKNGSNYSGYTFWEILLTDVTISTVNSKSTISWSSANGKAVSYCLCDIGGLIKCFNEITEEESAAGSITVDLYKLRLQLSSSSVFENVYLKVCFKGNYGRVTNLPFMVSL